ncbi:MAG: transporter related protein [Rhodospirillales bacterium]|nr:transporter related protein [Rhodospirillales bacterium]
MTETLPDRRRLPQLVVDQPAPDLLQVKDLHIHFHTPGGIVEAVRGASFRVRQGDTVAIVGESGSGKSVISQAIMGILPRIGRIARGEILFADPRLASQGQPGAIVDIAALPPDGAEMREIRGGRISIIFQEPMTSLSPLHTVGNQVGEALRLHRDVTAGEARDLTAEMLRMVGFPDPVKALKTYPFELSGGLRQRAMIAMALVCHPALLIADEPTTALDTLSQREVMELMVELARQNGVAVLLITHDLGLVARYAQRVVVLEKGLLVEAGETRPVLGDPQHPYTRRLVDSLPRRAAHRREPVASEPILAVRDACIEYPGKAGLFGRGAPKRVVAGVDLVVRASEIVAVVGASGSGKSTLGRAVLGLKPLAAGAISFDGVDLARMTADQRRAFRRQAQLVFQDPFSSLDPRVRIGETVGAALRHDPEITPRQRRERVRQVLADVSLAGFEDRFPHQMSGGQRQRVAIARAVVSRPRLVVADEPVSALDLTILLQVLTLFQQLQGQYGFACLFITHDLGVVEQIADRVYVMSAGAVVESGTTGTVFDDPQHAYTRALLDATPSLMAAAAGVA